MRSDPRLPPASAGHVTEEAARWALEAEHGLTAARAAHFEDWLAADPAHAPALAAAQEALTILATHAADAEIMDLRRAALAARPEPLALRRWPLVAAVVLLLAAPAGWLLTGQGMNDPRPVSMEAPIPTGTERYATAVGERSTVTLPDGSVMVLNTASQAEVAYSETSRTVRLLKGQALFTVAHGRPAPFRVEAGDRAITAVGTIFDVRMDGARIQVSMLEGTVRVEPRRPASASTVGQAETLTAGEVLVAAPREPVRVTTADVETLTSWREGLITFKDTPLAEAITEINRYASRPILLADSATGRHRLSGTFRVGDPQRFARLMTELFPLEMARTKEGNPVLKHRNL